MLVFNMHVVVSLGPVMTYEHHAHRRLLVAVGSSPRRPAAR